MNGKWILFADGKRLVNTEFFRELSVVEHPTKEGFGIIRAESKSSHQTLFSGDREVATEKFREIVRFLAGSSATIYRLE
jgi:hypothetical protein